MSIASELLPDERQLWSGRPVRYPVFTASDIVLVPFSLVWCGFAVFWLSSAASIGAPPAFVATGIPFVLIGVYFVAGRLVVRWRTLRSSLYAVTDRRVIVVSAPLGFRRTRTAYLRNLAPPTVNAREDGSGTITFGDSSVWSDLMRFGSGRITPRPIALEGIDGVREVQAIISKAQ
ncbi:hypothetical protein [Allokutzneria sp. NRRL B-24872]|uniref:hypothetical protein n=1 Tax=Allokutzneria sp. NRRL B-24872 TaxID=1137961 RepID=UPI000A3D51A3|nr:hypothetical protein [Allokutzneria sp. NRRL B-24872]